MNLNSTTIVPRNFDFGVVARARRPNARRRSTRSVSARRRGNRRPVGELISSLMPSTNRLITTTRFMHKPETDCSSRRTEYKDSIVSPRKRRATSGARRSRVLPSRFGDHSRVRITRATAFEISWSNSHVHLAIASCEITRVISTRRFEPRARIIRGSVAQKNSCY